MRLWIDIMENIYYPDETQGPAYGAQTDINADPSTPPAKTEKFMIATVPASNSKPQERDATGSAADQATNDKPITPVFDSGPEPLPERPQLLCSKCDFQSHDPERLAEHLIDIHGQTISASWFEAGQENERLYPRLRAPVGKFIVLGIDSGHSSGNISETFASLDEAIALAHHVEGSFPEIAVYDDSGHERYKLASNVHISPSSSASTNIVSSEPPLNPQKQLQSKTIKSGSDEEVVDGFLLKGKQDTPPMFVVIAGPVGTGKTTFRREKYAQDYVLIDAGELFDIYTADKSGDEAEKMEQRAMAAGVELVERSVGQRRNILIEILGDQEEPKKSILPKMASLGYQTKIEFIDCDVEEALRREKAGGRDNMSAYYSQDSTLLYFTTALIKM
jgi:predicted kinase